MLTTSILESWPDGIVCVGKRMARHQAEFYGPSPHALGIRIQA